MMRNMKHLILLGVALLTALASIIIQIASCEMPNIPNILFAITIFFLAFSYSTYIEERRSLK